MTEGNTSDPIDARVQVRLGDLVALEAAARRGRRRGGQPAATLPGAHAGVRRGRGMDYLESRAYQSGDDARHLDWRLTARSGRPHTKVFHEERDHKLMLLLDQHPSMRFATRGCFKSVQAARAAALLAWHTAHAGGRVGALAFGACRQAVPAMAQRRGALAVCGALARWDAARDAAGPEPLAEALTRLRPLAGGGSRLVLVTDGRSAGPRLQATLAAWRRRARLSVLLVVDALEQDTPPPGVYPLQVGDRITRLDLTANAARSAFRETMRAPAERMRAAGAALGIPVVTLTTMQDPCDGVRAWLERS